MNEQDLIDLRDDSGDRFDDMMMLNMIDDMNRRFPRVHAKPVVFCPANVQWNAAAAAAAYPRILGVK